MKNRRKNLIISLLPLAIVPIAYIAGYIYQNYLRIYVFPCPVNTFWHIYCPGCGGTRCFYALLNGDIAKALKCNALAAAAVVLALLYWGENVFSLANRSVKLIPRSRGFTITASGIAVAYVILRNFIPAIAPS